MGVTGTRHATNITVSNTQVRHRSAGANNRRPNPRTRCDDGSSSAAILLVMNWRDRIVIDEQVHHGQACIHGTRVVVSVILDNLAVGEKPEEIVARHPALTLEDVRAAMSYAAELARERVIEIQHERA